MSALLSIRVDDAINAEIEAIANQQHNTKTEIVRIALAQYLKSRQSKLLTQMAILHKIDNDDDYIGEDL